MALGFASATADSVLNAFGNATAYTGVANLYVKLHTGVPGTGTSNAANTTTRHEVTFGTSSAGTMLNDAAITWTTGETGSDTVTHCSVWSSSTAGSLLATGTITANAFVAGDVFTIAIGGFSVVITPAS